MGQAVYTARPYQAAARYEDTPVTIMIVDFRFTFPGFRLVLGCDIPTTITERSAHVLLNVSATEICNQ